ncbi:MAG: PQQ-dependent sugar dehydrogenase [Candidatus Limnocylindria bacterium]
MAVLATACAPGSEPIAVPPSSPGPSSPAPASPAATATPVPRDPLLADEVVQSGLEVPWDLAFAPDGRMFVTERPGRVVIFESGEPNAPRLGEMTVPDVRAVRESGLMGIALHPDFDANGLLYVCASRTVDGEWRNQVLSVRAEGNTLALEGVVIAEGMRANRIHDGCTVRFGPDGQLWVTMGEAGSGPLSQDPTVLNGKVLRLDPDGSIPDDNPVLPGAERSAVYTWGHRNPQGLAFEPGSGRAFLVEHGANTHDEINLLEAGANYGWPAAAGPDPEGRFSDPLWSSGGSTLATSGATFVTGEGWGTWSGSLLVATLKENDLRRFVVGGTTVTPAEVLLDGKYGRLRTPVLGPDGALYVTTSNGSGDRIIRVTATQPPG